MPEGSWLRLDVWLLCGLGVISFTPGTPASMVRCRRMIDLRERRSVVAWAKVASTHQDLTCSFKNDIEYQLF
jgi:hypothetical protein